MIERIKKFCFNNYKIIVPLSIFFVGFLIFNLVTPAMVDDVGFINTINKMGGYNLKNISEFMIDKHKTWSSRLPIFFLEISCVRIPILFRFLNTILVSAALIPIFSYLTKNHHLVFGVITSSLFLVLNIPLCLSAGLVASSVNYLWPFAFAVPSVVITYKYVINKSVKIWEVIVSIILLVVLTCWSEATIIPLFIIFMFSFVYILYFHKKINYATVIYSILSIGFIIYALKWPGNTNRLHAELERCHYLDFYNLNFADKLFNRSVFNAYYGMMAFAIPFNIIVAVIIFLKKEKAVIKINSVFSLFCLIIYAICNAFKETEFYNRFISSQLTISYVSIVFIGFAIASFFVNIFYLEKGDVKQLCLTLIIVLSAIASTAMCGFGLNVGTRNLWYGYYLFIPITIFYLIKMCNILKEFRTNKI